MSQISELLRQLVDIDVKSAEIVKVSSVVDAETEYTIDAIRVNNPEYVKDVNEDMLAVTGIRLTPFRTENINISIPEIDSLVLIVYDEQDIPYVVLMSKVSKIVTVISDEINYSSGNKIIIEGKNEIDFKTVKFKLDSDKFKMDDNNVSFNSNKFEFKNNTTDLKSIVTDLLSLCQDIITTTATITASPSAALNNPMMVNATTYIVNLNKIKANLNNLM